MRKLSLLTVSLIALAGSLGTALAQDSRPATHRGTGTEIANNYLFFHEDRARMENGRYRQMMDQAQQNMDAYTNLRAREGRPAQPGRR